MELDDPIRRRLTVALAIMIMGGWVIAFLRDMTEETYDIPGELTSGLILLAGWCFVDGTVRAIRKTASDNEERPREQNHNDT